MAIFPCDTKSLCVDPSTPFANFSAEAPDQHIFIGRSTGFSPLDPPLGSDFQALGCVTFCESTVSQQDADLCALRQNAECLSFVWPVEHPGVDVFGNPVPVPAQRQLFPNRAQTATVQCPDGLPFAFTVPAGRYVTFSQAQSDQAALSEAQRDAMINLLCLGPLTPSLVCSGDVYAGSIVATSNFLTDATACWQIFGALPPGINSDLDMSFGCRTGSTTLNFFGTPTTPGIYPFSIEVSDAAGNFMVKPVSLLVRGITSGDLPAGTVGTAYSQFLTSFGFTNPIYSVEVGALPDGLVLDPTGGTITGTPTVANTFDFIVGITEAGTGVVACLQSMEIVIAMMSNCAVVPTEQDSFTNVDGFGECASYQRPAGDFLMVVDGDGTLEVWDVSGPAAVSHDTAVPSFPDFPFGGGIMDYSVKTSEWVVIYADGGTGQTTLYLFSLAPVTHLIVEDFRIGLGYGVGFGEPAHQVICDDVTGIAYILSARHLIAFNTSTRTIVTTRLIDTPCTVGLNFVIPPADNTTTVNVLVGDSSFFAVNEIITPAQNTFGLFRVTAIPDATHITLVYPTIVGNTHSGATVLAGQAFASDFAGIALNNAIDRVSFGYNPATERLYVGRTSYFGNSTNSVSTVLDTYHGSGLTKVGQSALITAVLPTLQIINAGCVFNPTDGRVYYVEANDLVPVSNTIIRRVSASSGAILSTLTIASVSPLGGVLFNNESQQIYVWAEDDVTFHDVLKVVCATSLSLVTTYDLTVLGLTLTRDLGQTNIDTTNHRFYIPFATLTKGYGFP